MKTICVLIFLLVYGSGLKSQSLYFPPVTGTTWDTISPASLGWCPDKIDTLLNYLGSQNTKAFLVLVDGKIVIEKYYGQFNQDSLWYWASAGKTVTGMLVGIAQVQGYLSIHDTVSEHLGNGWTSCTPAKESLITIKDQLSMTSGLDDAVSDPFCTLPSCLTWLADAGSRWAYHNAPYTLLDSVIIHSTGMSFNNFFFSRLRNFTGMNGAFLPQGYNNIYFSNARSMARFGLLMLNRGKWDTTVVLSDTSYFHEMTNTSNPHNLSYGYLTWLNGKNSFMIPQSQMVFNGPLVPAAPSDMYAAMGKNGQILNVVPGMKLLVIRMGNAPGSGTSDITPVFNNEIWLRLLDVFCGFNGITENETEACSFSVTPNPAYDVIHLNTQVPLSGKATMAIFDVSGKIAWQGNYNDQISISGLAKGLYFIQLHTIDGMTTRRFVKQ